MRRRFDSTDVLVFFCAPLAVLLLAFGGALAAGVTPW